MKPRKTTRIWGEDVPLKAPCFFEMTNMDLMSPNVLFQSHQHSRCAEKFHQFLKERTGIEAVGSFAYGNLATFPQMQLFLWVRDSEITEQILHNTPCQPCCRENPLFPTIMDCLLDALREDGNGALADVEKLWNKQKNSDANGEKQIYVSATVYSYRRCYTDNLLGATAEKITQGLNERFPSYERLLCCAYSLEVDGLAHNHLFLFLTPEDEQRARASGDTEQMRKLAYDIIHPRDIFGYVTYEAYAPQIANRRMLSSEQIFFAVRDS